MRSIREDNNLPVLFPQECCENIHYLRPVFRHLHIITLSPFRFNFESKVWVKV